MPITYEWVKLYGRILDSSIMECSIPARLFFIQAIVASDNTGRLFGTVEVLARRFNMPENVVVDSLNELSAPDPGSKNKEYGGARLVSTGPQEYLVVTKPDHNPDPTNAERQARWRNARNARNDDVTARNEDDDGNDRGEERRVEEKREKKRKENISLGHSSSESEDTVPTKRVRYTADFEAFWMAFGPPSRRLGKGAAAKIWGRLPAEDREKAVDTLPAFKESNRGKEDRHIATAPTYLAQRRFDDFDGAYPPTDKGRENYRKQMEAQKNETP